VSANNGRFWSNRSNRSAKKEDLTERLRKANLKSAEEANAPEEIKAIEERYHEEVVKIEKTIKNAEEQLAALHETRDTDAKPILLVDDEKNIRLTLSHSLESLGLPIQTAVNGEEALQKLQEG
jgi:CheY-like chemotaxis protein